MRNILFFLIRNQIILLSLLSLFLTFNIHSKDPLRSYHHVLWADGAGYYIYLPATFNYGWDTKNFADSTEAGAGNGFRINKSENKIFTKYTYGVSLLQLPFYLGVLVHGKITGEVSDGFGKAEHVAIMLAGLFYGMLGLYFLKRTLLLKFPEKITALTILFVFLSTNLFYYTIDKGSYAHVYLFFLFSFLLFHLPAFLNKPGFKNSSLFFIALFLAILIRPTSIFMVPLILFSDVQTRNDLKERISVLAGNFRNYIAGAIVSLLIFAPQITYWKYLTGNLITWSYGEEGFTNLASPSVAEFLFSPDNGLFLYTPALLILFSALFFYMWKSFYPMLLFLTFLLMIYLFSSWHDPTFGCSFGSRSMVEFYAFISAILARILCDLEKNKKLILRSAIVCSLIYLSYVNVKTTYEYDDCYYGEKWDFNNYFKTIRLY